VNIPSLIGVETTILNMKNKLKILWILPLLLLFSGCVSVKTQHRIEPISITVDVNVKVDRALDDFFGDLDAQAQEIASTDNSNE